MDLRKISPFGRKMTKRGPFDVAQDMLCAFAGDIPSFGCGSAALRFLWLDFLSGIINRG
jgi:hypothetical protein